MSDADTPIRPVFLKAIVISLLLICAVQAYLLVQMRNETGIDGLSPALIRECANEIAGRIETNTISDEVLAPRLLDDRDEMDAYVAAFPVEDYEIVPMAGRLVGAKLYLDQNTDVIKDEIRAGNVWESTVIDQIIPHVRPSSTVIDIGAHIGAHTLYMSRMAGPAGRVYAFEPQKKLYRELVHNMQLNGALNVVPLRYAIGDTSGVIEMNMPTEGNEGGTSVGKGGDQAELRTIDSFGFDNVSLIKIDVESMEDPVLRGARQTILRSRPVLLVEIQGGYIPESAPPEVRERIEATTTDIESMGYQLIRIGVYDYMALPITDI